MRFFTPGTQAQPPMEAVVDTPNGESDKEKGVGVNTQDQQNVDTDADTISSDLQAGVKDMEAITSVWSTQHLILAYALIWIIYFVDAMQQGMSGALTPYVTSSFQLHSLTATTGIVSGLVGGIFKLPLAKILDIWGRPQGFLIMVCFLVLGLVMMAACQNVETYAAAQVFYWVGYNGLSFTLGIFVADTSALKNRAFMFAFISSPYIATVWIGGPLATAFLKGPGFRWGFGAFAIITLFICMPLYALFAYNYNKAKKAGLTHQHSSGRTFLQSVKYYAIEFDIFGILLICAGLALFLLPFNLVFNQPLGWKSPMIICMIVFGIVAIGCFAVWEKYFAPVKFMPWELLADRTILGACVLAAVLFISFYIWDSYFTSFLQVVQNLTITESSYIVNIYSIGSCFWALVTGVLIRWTGRFKWLALYFGIPLTILGVALMINFRQPDVNIGYIIMCQIFIALAGGTLVICDQMAAMAATTHQYIAVVLAVEGMFSNIGGAIGSTVAGAIWQGVFPERLMRYLPEEDKADFANIYGQLPVQLSYPVGSATRHAINRAYGDAQRLMLIGGSTVLILALVSVIVWRDIRVKDFNQVKGRVIKI
ncbi:Siderophore iron transporter mirB [Venustampulla echinocandica]|uniref:Siderophore iron transporter mirB n=1 Tax=Venustampulla echinocandica TaxID=2656787 RepID=A0A370TE38_9HELO|nr:Siderophore iron transporter mirB [Venustampulla echinocandica]RDL32936.1 Siderophore iron transporter mirB [Venustampulla echinocandica]